MNNINLPNDKDFIKYNNALKRKIFFDKLINDPNNADALVYMLAITVLSVIMPIFIPVDILSSSILIKKIIDIDKMYADAVVEDYLYSSLKNTDTYHECINAYEEYLDEYAKFMKSIGIQSPKEISIMYKTLLDRGLLSHNRQHKYDSSYKRNKEKYGNGVYYMELTNFDGCHVATGTSICRHMSSLLTDIQNRVGNSAYDLAVNNSREIPVKNNAISLAKTKNNIISNHQVTLIKDNGSYYAYCPTVGIFIQFNDYIDNKKDKEDRIILGNGVTYRDKGNTIKDKCNHIVSKNDNMKLFFDTDTTIIDDLFSGDFKELNKDELNEMYNGILKILSNRDGEVMNFYNDTQPKLNTINNCINKMVAKKKVKELIIE